MLWNLSGTLHVIAWFKRDRSFVYPVEVHVWAHVRACVSVCVRTHAIVVARMLSVIIFRYAI